MVQPYVLELDGKLAGRFLSFHYSSPGAVVLTPSVPNQLKVVAARDPEKMTATFAAGLSDTFYKWVASVASNKSVPKHGSVYVLDAKSKPKSRIQFQDALIESVALPELQGGTKDSAFITIVFRPELVKYEAVDGASGKFDLGVYTSNQAKASRISDFKLRIDGLDDPCKWVKRVSPITFGRKFESLSTGHARQKSIYPGSTEFSNLVFDISYNQSGKFQDWMKDGVAGKNATEKTGSLELLAPGLTKAYFEVGLTGLGILSFSKVDSNTARVELYCSSMSLKAGSSSIM